MFLSWRKAVVSLRCQLLVVVIGTASGVRFALFVVDRWSCGIALRVDRVKIAPITAVTVPGRAFARGPFAISNFR